MNIDQRAEKIAGIGAEIDGIKSALRALTPDLRTPMATARLLLLSLTCAAGGNAAVDALKAMTGRTPIVLAADPNNTCTIPTFPVYGFEFIDDPRGGGRSGLVDPGDFVIGSTDFGNAVVNIAGSEPRKDTMVVRGDHAETVFTNLSGRPTTRGKNGDPALEVKVSFENDRIRSTVDPTRPPDISVVVRCGENGVAVGGRYATEDAIRTVLRNAAGVYSVGSRLDQLMNSLFGPGRNLGLTLKGEDPKQNLAFSKQNLDNIIAQAKAVREGERQAAATPTATATVTATVTATATPTSKKPDSDGGDILAGAREAASAIADQPARIFSPDAQQPQRTTIDLVGWLAALGLVAGLVFDRPRDHLRRIRLSQPRTRIWNTIALSVREIRHRHALRVHQRGLANGTIPAGTPPPARGFPGFFGV